MCHHGDALASVPGGEGVDHSRKPLPERVVTLATGNTVPSAGEAPGHPFGVGRGGPATELAVAPIAHAHLFEILVRFEGESAARCEWRGCLYGAGEMR